jgi:hypothetical protein
MKRTVFTLLSTALLVTCGFATDIAYRYLGTIKTPSPAFLSVEKFGTEQETLLISSFGAFSSGKVSIIPNIRDVVNNKQFGTAQAQILSDAYRWPNSISTVPANVFGSGVKGIVVPDGFLPPGKGDGGVYILVQENGKWVNHQISTLKSGYFYHAGEWLDINGDGRKDYLTARTNAQAGSGELVWFEQPVEGLNKLPWTEHIISKGPDVIFDIQTNLKGHENSVVVFATEFFNKKLSVYEFGLGATNGGKLINSKIIDTTIDQAYSVKYIDINGDGKHELLVNNHESDDAKAGIFLYDVPTDIFNGVYNKRQIASGFKNVWNLFIPNMSPGFPYAVKPSKTSPYHILVAGDGDHSAHLMRPDG